MVGVAGDEAEAAVHGLRRRIGRLHLQVGVTRPERTSVVQHLDAQPACQALPAGGLDGVDVVQAHQIAFNRMLAAGEQLAVAPEQDAGERHRRVGKPLGVGLAQGERRLAQGAGDLREAHRPDALDAQAATRRHDQ